MYPCGSADYEEAREEDLSDSQTQQLIATPPPAPLLKFPSGQYVAKKNRTRRVHDGLGVDVNSQAGHRALSHGRGVSGFTAQNRVFPDQKVAVVLLTDQDAGIAPGQIPGITALLFTPDDPSTPTKLEP